MCTSTGRRPHHGTEHDHDLTNGRKNRDHRNDSCYGLADVLVKHSN